MKNKIRIIGIMTGEHIDGNTHVDFTRWHPKDFKHRTISTYYHVGRASSRRAIDAMLTLRRKEPAK